MNHKYKARYRSLLFNLKDEKNKALFRRVVSKTISSDQLVVMSHDQLASDELSKWREEELKKVDMCVCTGHRGSVCPVLVLFACVRTVCMLGCCLYVHVNIVCMCGCCLHVWVLFACVYVVCMCGYCLQVWVLFARVDIDYMCGYCLHVYVVCMYGYCLHVLLYVLFVLRALCARVVYVHMYSTVTHTHYSSVTRSIMCIVLSSLLHCAS